MVLIYLLRKFFRCAVFIILFTVPGLDYSMAQLNISPSGTAAGLAAAITGPGVSVFNVQYQGAPQSGVEFNAPNSNLGITGGILLCTGPAVIAAGANSLGDAGVDMGLGGDAQLNQLSGGTTFDATVLEFDFIPQSSQVRFRYVFASEEYPEYVCSEYNDVFGFFISGPGISGVSNMAIVPGTSMPVAINSVNGGAVGAAGLTSNPCQLGNSALYVDNSSGASLEFDGFTVVLEAIATVVPCQTYHLRLAIADVGDGIYDSGVFIESESLSSEPVVDAGPDLSFCSVASVQLGMDPAPGWNYTWTPSAGLSSSIISNPTLNLVNNGIADTVIRYVVSASSQTCTMTDTVEITVSPQSHASLDISADSVCTGQMLTLSINGTVSSTAAIQWDFDGAASVGGSGMGPLQINYLDEGRHAIHVQITQSVCELILSDTVLVKPVPAPVFSADPVIGCAPLDVQFNNLTLCNNCSVVSSQWDFGDGQTGTQMSPDLTYRKAGIYDVGLLVCSSLGCCSDTVYHDFIKVFPSPDAGFRIMPETTVSLVDQILFRDDSRGAAGWSWEFGDGFSSQEPSPLHAFPDTGNYMVRQVVINDYGCSDTLIRQIDVEPVSTIWIPNAFSPNNDGVNDSFRVYGDYVRDITWSVFNRWGEVIFGTTGSSDAWNGEWDGRAADQGVYLCRVNYRDWENKPMELYGKVTLLR